MLQAGLLSGNLTILWLRRLMAILFICSLLGRLLQGLTSP